MKCLSNNFYEEEADSCEKLLHSHVLYVQYCGASGLMQTR